MIWQSLRRFLGKALLGLRLELHPELLLERQLEIHGEVSKCFRGALLKAKEGQRGLASRMLID
jgi:hypothetical protein